MMKRDLTQFTSKQFDVLIVGGGIYGAAIAWEACLRGLSVALVEKGDFGSGVSANSQKLIHGGFGYLQQFNLKRMRQSIRERRSLMQIAPHLVHPMPVIIPTYRHGLHGKEIIAIALRVYEALSFDRNWGLGRSHQIPPGILLSKKEVLDRFPHLPEEHLTGGALFYDAQVYNSERLVLAFIQSAVSRGAVVANYVKAVGLIYAHHLIEGIRARDELSAQTFDIRSKAVINAGGPWILDVLGDEGRSLPHCRYWAKGFNILTKKIFSHHALGFFQKRGNWDLFFNKGKRAFLIVPWREYSIFGTAYQPFDASPDELHISQEEVEIFLRDLKRALPGLPLDLGDITMVHQGVVPSDGNHSRTGEPRITGRFRIIEHSGQSHGLMTVLGADYASIQDVASRTIHHLLNRFGWTRSKRFLFSLEGGSISNFDRFLKQEMETFKGYFDSREMKSLIYNYGTQTKDMMSQVVSQTGHSMKNLVEAQTQFSVTHEMAMNLSDVILRRTEWGSAGHPGQDILRWAGSSMGRLMKWSPEKIEEEIFQMNRFYDRMLWKI